MQLNFKKELAAIQRMSVGELKTKYAEVFGEAARSGHRQYLVRRIAWRLQALAEGGLSERARRRAAELADEADLRVTAPRSFAVNDCVEAAAVPANESPRLPMPGTVLTRAYKGRTIQVTVLENGIEFDGEIYRSLSAVAKKITGAHWNGYHFFRLDRQGGES